MQSPDYYTSLIGKMRDAFDLIKFLDGLDIGAYIVNKNRIITYWNKKAQELTGFSAEEVIGKSCMDNILSHTDALGVPICKTQLCPLIRAIKTKKSAFVPFAVYTKLKNSKKRVPFNVFAFPVLIEGLDYAGIEFFQVAHQAEDIIRAMRIQKSLLPTDLSDDFELFYHPSNFLGGDMLFKEDDYFGLIDVSGHGIDSSLISTSLLILIKDLIKTKTDLDDFGDEIEKRYRDFQITDKYFTGIFGKITGTKSISLISFAHPKPLKRKRSGEIVELDMDNDMPIGFDLPHTVVKKEFILESGDEILLYSDGITEIKTEKGLLNTEGFMEILKKERDLNEVFTQCMEQSIEQFQNDDISLLKLKIL